MSRGLRITKQIFSGFIMVFIMLTFNVIAHAEIGEVIPNPPTHNIYVQDYAHILNENTISKIMREATEQNHKTTQQICVVTVESLKGYPIEECSNALFNKWGIGQKGKNNGVLILVATNERKARIEVGRGLEGYLMIFKLEGL